MKTNQPLEEFEFRQAAEIRKPEPSHRIPRTRRTTVSTWLLWALAVTSLALTGLVWHLMDRLHQARTSLQAVTESRDESLQKFHEAKMELDATNQMLNRLKKKLDTSSKGKKQLLDEIDLLKQQLRAAERKQKTAEQERDRTRSKLTHAETQLKQVQQQVAELQARIQNLTREKDELTAELDEARDGIDQLKREMKTLRGSMNQEGEASRKIAGELLRKEQENARLNDQLKKLKTELADTKKKLNIAERVDEGDLVPLSDRVTPAVPLVHPPVVVKKKGLFSKVRGFVLVNALIDEVGQVHNAVLLEPHLEHADQPASMISRALAQVMKWKFSPAMYDGTIRVQVWQTVAVPVTTE